jgi:hypothetical protein
MFKTIFFNSKIEKAMMAACRYTADPLEIESRTSFAENAAGVANNVFVERRP